MMQLLSPSRCPRCHNGQLVVDPEDLAVPACLQCGHRSYAEVAQPKPRERVERRRPRATTVEGLADAIIEVLTEKGEESRYRLRELLGPGMLAAELDQARCLLGDRVVVIAGRLGTHRTSEVWRLAGAGGALDRDQAAQEPRGPHRGREPDVGHGSGGVGSSAAPELRVYGRKRFAEVLTSW